MGEEMDATANAGDRRGREQHPADANQPAADRIDAKMPSKKTKLSLSASDDFTSDDVQKSIVGVFGDEVLAHIGSYVTATDMLNLALTCRGFGMKTEGRELSLMEEAAKIFLIQGIDQAYNRISSGVSRDYRYLKRRIVSKSAQGKSNEDEETWIGLVHELEMCFSCWPAKVVLGDLIEVRDFEQELTWISDPNKAITHVHICGPEYNAFEIENAYIEEDEFEARCVPEEHTKQVLHTISKLPRLREIIYSPGWNSQDGGDLEPSRLCWLLSSESKFRTLCLSNLHVWNDSDVISLAAAFASCTSIESLCIMPIFVGTPYEPVSTIAPLIQAIGGLPKLKRLRLGFESYYDIAVSRECLQGIRGLEYIPKDSIHYHELRNCSDIDSNL